MQPQGDFMNRLLVAFTATGLLLSASAMAQNSNTDNQKLNAPDATTTKSDQGAGNSAAGPLQNDTLKKQQRVQTNDRDRSVSGRKEDRDQRNTVSTHSRSTVGMRIHERDEFRHRRGFG